MPLDREDKMEIKDMMEELLQSYSNQVNSKFEIIDYKLDSIETQTKRTNGRLINAEQKITNLEVLEKTHDVNHINVCPNITKIRALEDSQLTNVTIKKFLKQAVAMISLIVGIAVGVISLVIIFKT